MQAVRNQRPTDIRNVTLQRELRALYVEDVMEILGIGQSKAYAIMRRINKELEAEGFETIAGRVSEARFREKFYCGTTERSVTKGKELAAYTEAGTFAGEREDTVNLLTFENGISPEEITIKEVHR